MVHHRRPLLPNTGAYAARTVTVTELLQPSNVGSGAAEQLRRVFLGELGGRVPLQVLRAEDLEI